MSIDYNHDIYAVQHNIMVWYGRITVDMRDHSCTIEQHCMLTLVTWLGNLFFPEGTIAPLLGILKGIKVYDGDFGKWTIDTYAL